MNGIALNSAKVLTPLLSQSFSSDVATKNYDKFKKKFLQHQQFLAEKEQQQTDSRKEELVKPPTKAYSHPNHTDHHPIVFS